MSHKYPVVYACLNKNEEVRRKSSSGGIFFLLAQEIIEKGGVVFGARFNEEWEVVHDSFETMDAINPFLGSKYVQSKMNNMYQRVKECLEAERYVLFSGTPCQVAGLYTFLGKAYEKLLTVDFICHGVPSPTVWKEYLKEISKGKKITNVCFRDKTDGWINYSLKIEYTDGHIYKKYVRDDLYMIGFLQDIYLRPSCYECSFKGIDRRADITLGDLWGIQTICPQLHDDKGTSVVLLNSDRAKAIWKQLASDIECVEIDVNDVIRTNNSLVKKVPFEQKKIAKYKKTKGNVLKKIKAATKDSRRIMRWRKLKKDVKNFLKYDSRR